MGMNAECYYCDTMGAHRLIVCSLLGTIEVKRQQFEGFWANSMIISSSL